MYKFYEQKVSTTFSHKLIIAEQMVSNSQGLCGLSVNLTF